MSIFKVKNEIKINSAAKQLIAINHIQNKSFCLHNICMFTVFIYLLYIQVHLNKLECRGKGHLFQ